MAKVKQSGSMVMVITVCVLFVVGIITYITAKDVFDLAKEGDEGAETVVRQMGGYLGKAMAHIAVTINPEAFIIGGGVSKAGEYLIDAVKTTYRETCFTACGDAAVHLAELGNDAGMYGAAALVVR